jgi:hypothetical protein
VNTRLHLLTLFTALPVTQLRVVIVGNAFLPLASARTHLETQLNPLLANEL